jgi:hypothetical protein
MSTGERLPFDPSIAVGNHFLHMEVFLTAIVAGLLVGLVYCLVKVRVREPSLFALIGLAVILLGQIIACLYPFGIGLLLGLAYDSFEEEWYGSTIADSARRSYRLRLFLTKSLVGRVSRCLWSGDFAPRSAVTRLRRGAQLSNVFDIRNPPLRERCEDIVILARAFLQERGQSTGGARMELTAAAMDTLYRHEWPGNVRELHNALERATIVSDDGLTRAQDLSLAPRARVSVMVDNTDLNVVERQAIERMMRNVSGNKARAAR